MTKKKFKKVVEWKEREVSGGTIVMFTFFALVFGSVQLMREVPELGDSVFPLGWLWIGYAAALLFSAIVSLRRKVYWEEI